ncbi:MAG: 3-oxoacyl-[acyl-carrier-protein] synthase III C-terminal domain-containing protein [Opitutaceae bacterium]|nr:3-oxoacyl-[acyl-carrier-protein] synthase III C-terminal domain-containing protein [Opitutaceae bacterium]
MIAIARMQQHFRITGTGGYLPRKVITAAELDARLNLEPGWTLRHTGVATRHQRAPDETATAMARHAALAAIAAAGLTLRDIDAIVDASTCQQQPIPSNAALLHKALGPEVRGAAAVDVHATCLSFVVALATANGWFASGLYRHVLIVSSETPLDGVNWADPASACLMGEGAAAAVLTRATAPAGECSYGYETFGEHAHVCEVAGGGHRLPPFAFSVENEARYRFFMDGPKLHKIASRHLPPLVARILTEARADLAALHVIPHQASGPAVELLARRLGIAREQLHVGLAEHGNLVAAGIPYALHTARGTIPAGSRVLMVGTAAGYSQAAFVFTL